ncbi:MAG: cyclic nucleotide-binding domain-containing protein [Phyllobacteriaceae bacterium]|nr:cyclic nucleotide-binding domain-containing protein [Phyllobacteriaceae bacterium]
MADILDYCSGLEEVRFKSGQNMLPEGERLGKLLILIEGQVEVIRERTQVTHVDEPGSIFGEMAVLLDMPHSATVKALSDVRAYEIPDALTFLDTRPEFSLHIATMLARRLYYTTSYLVDLQQQAAGKRQDLDLVDEILASLVDPAEAGKKKKR